MVISASQTTSDEGTPTDLCGRFNLGVKISEVYITDVTDKNGPVLELSDKSKKESVEPTRKAVVNTDLARLLMSKFNLK